MAAKKTAAAKKAEKAAKVAAAKAAKEVAKTATPNVYRADMGESLPAQPTKE